MTKLFIISGLILMLVCAVGVVVHEKSEVEKLPPMEIKEDEINYYERVELYYNLDDESKVYEKSKEGLFKEVILSGN